VLVLNGSASNDVLGQTRRDRYHSRFKRFWDVLKFFPSMLMLVIMPFISKRWKKLEVKWSQSRVRSWFFKKKQRASLLPHDAWAAICFTMANCSLGFLQEPSPSGPTGAGDGFSDYLKDHPMDRDWLRTRITLSKLDHTIYSWFLLLHAVSPLNYPIIPNPVRLIENNNPKKGPKKQKGSLLNQGCLGSIE